MSLLLAGGEALFVPTGNGVDTRLLERTEIPSSLYFQIVVLLPSKLSKLSVPTSLPSTLV